MDDAPSLPQLKPFDAGQVRRHLEAVDHLSTFEEVSAWDQEAESHVQQIERYLAGLAQLVGAIDAFEHQARSAHAGKTFWKRLLQFPVGVGDARELRVRAAAAKELLLSLSDQLTAYVDKTPNSREEQRDMLKELRLAKKELSIKRREINEDLRQIRAESRVRNARVGTGLGLLISTPGSRRLSRMSIRLEKEAAVAPNETAKAQIERQILVVDRAIHWIEKFD